MSAQAPLHSSYEVLTTSELAPRWRVKPSWIYDQTRSSCDDPIPHTRLGKQLRFLWGSPALEEWWQRRTIDSRQGIRRVHTKGHLS
jgi:hypothetical protein